MVASEPTTEAPDGPVTTLRGAGVDIDPRWALRMVVGVSLVAVTVVASLLLAAGVKKNSQAVSLHDRGVPVSVTVSGCLGLLGGSGSNAAGYACKGSYTFAGQHYRQDIPGNKLLHPGDVIQGVIVPGDPRLLSTPAAVADQHASWRVFIAPAILFALVLFALAVVVAGRRRRSSRVPVESVERGTGRDRVTPARSVAR